MTVLVFGLPRRPHHKDGPQHNKDSRIVKLEKLDCDTSGDSNQEQKPHDIDIELLLDETKTSNHHGLENKGQTRESRGQASLGPKIRAEAAIHK